MDTVAPFNPQQLEAISRILAHTEKGLTGSDIGYILGDCKIPDVDPTNSKWKRLFNAFVSIQNEKRIGNYVLMFIGRAMDPVKYTKEPSVFAFRKDELNTVLALCGMSVRDDGKITRAPKAQHLTQALERANRLHAALVLRNVHKDVLQFCRAELLDQNYFHAVFEAMKSIAAKISSLSHLTLDGRALVDAAFGMPNSQAPLLAINDLRTETDKGEQRGFANLLIGLFGTIRNPLAHNAKIEWDMEEQDALDILTTASLIHRKLDRARCAPTS